MEGENSKLALKGGGEVVERASWARRRQNWKLQELTASEGVREESNEEGR